MKKFTLMLALALFSMAANALTVFYNNTASNWTNVYAYTFSEETLGKWPGTEMKAVADHAGWFSIEVDETKATKIIFNNNNQGKQTGDLTLNAAKPYYNDGWTSSFDGEVIVEIYTIYYKNVDNWDKVYAYGWGGAAVTAGWPGNEMTAVADHAGWFSLDFKGGVPANIIFNNNSGSKTDDLTVDPENLYYNNGWTNSFDGEVVIVLPDKMYLKHPFENNAWEWREMTKQDNGTFSRKDYWQGGGVNVNTTAGDAGAKWISADQITGAPAATGMMVTYTYDYAASTLSVVADETPLVVLDVPERAVVNEEVTFSATAMNIENPVYTYSVKAPEATDFVALEGVAYTPAAEGVYTVKVSVAGDGGATAEDTKEMTVTAPVQITGDFYLVGYINGADYGCEDDADNMGEYHFVNGALTATFTQDSYVFVKTGDNKNWFMSKTYVAESPATLYNTATTTAGEKMFVPGNKQISFTLLGNTDGTLTLSYQIEDTPSAVENVTAGYALTLNNGCLSVATDKAASVALYTIGGQLLDMQFTSDYRCTLNAGIYILRVDNTTEKLVVF